MHFMVQSEVNSALGRQEELETVIPYCMFLSKEAGFERFHHKETKLVCGAAYRVTKLTVHTGTKPPHNPSQICMF